MAALANGMEVDDLQGLQRLKPKKSVIFPEMGRQLLCVPNLETKETTSIAIEFPSSEHDKLTHNIKAIEDFSGPFYKMLLSIASSFASETAKLTCKRDQLYDRLTVLRNHWNAGTFPPHIQSRSSSATVNKQLAEQLALYARQQLLKLEIEAATSKYDELNDKIMRSCETLVKRIVDRVLLGSLKPPSTIIFLESTENPLIKTWFEAYQTTLIKFRANEKKALERKLEEREKHKRKLEEQQSAREQKAAEAILKPSADLKHNGRSIDHVEVFELKEQIKVMQAAIRKLKITSSGNAKASPKSGNSPTAGLQQKRQGAKTSPQQKQKKKPQTQGKPKQQPQHPTKQKKKTKKAEN